MAFPPSHVSTGLLLWHDQEPSGIAGIGRLDLLAMVSSHSRRRTTLIPNPNRWSLITLYGNLSRRRILVLTRMKTCLCGDEHLVKKA